MISWWTVLRQSSDIKTDLQYWDPSFKLMTAASMLIVHWILFFNFLTKVPSVQKISYFTEGNCLLVPSTLILGNMLGLGYFMCRVAYINLRKFRRGEVVFCTNNQWWSCSTHKIVAVHLGDEYCHNSTCIFMGLLKM